MPFMDKRLRVGMRVPAAMLSELGPDGQVNALHTETLLSGVRVLVIGVPGAFTPICTRQHLPPFIEKADALKRSGFKDVICITTSDPFSVSAWQRQIDPAQKLHMLSDGNLDFTRATGLMSLERDLFLGERSCRYAMILENAIVTKLSVETSVLSVSCSSADVMLECGPVL